MHRLSLPRHAAPRGAPRPVPVGVVAAAGGYVAALVTTALALVVLVALRAVRPLVRRFRVGTAEAD